jgi:RNA polymerase sigma-70 factor (ECF subfamily)
MKGMESPESGLFRSAQFGTTHWSIVRAAAGKASPAARQALEALCQTYWYPLYAYARRRVLDIAEAQDLTQSFFAELLEKDYLVAATPERGRFRAFLLTAFKHFLSKQWAKARAQKRGRRPPLPLDFASAEGRLAAEPCSTLTAEQLYERQWAMTLLRNTMERLQQELDQAGKGAQFDALKGFLIGEHPGTTYADVAARLNMTEAAARMAASRMRSRYRQLLKQAIVELVAEPSEIDEEIAQLFATLAR